MRTGTVYLVGAGPGASDLLTLRALAVLESVDAVLFDRLVSQDILNRIPAQTALINVGKELGKNSQERQDWIEAELIRRAKRGQNVARLKGGDPFVFGRGSEEMLALRESEVPYEIIPGISSVIAAPQSVDIPLTHRGLSSGFSVFTGHPAEGQSESVDWDLAARAPTAVFLMGLRRLPRIAQSLIDHGRCPETPVAVIASATRGEQKVVSGPLRDIAERAEGLRSPATIVVGDVVTFLRQESPAKSLKTSEELLLVDVLAA